MPSYSDREKRLFRAKTIQLVMLRKRGYEITDKKELELLEWYETNEASYDETDQTMKLQKEKLMAYFLKTIPPPKEFAKEGNIFYYENLNNLYFEPKGNEKKLTPTLVYFMIKKDEKNIGKDDIMHFLSVLKERKSKTEVVLVIDRGMGTYPLDTINGLTMDYLKVKESKQVPLYFVQIFNVTELAFDPSEHAATVPHSRIDKAEFVKAHTKEGLKAFDVGNLPEIKMQDAQLKFMSWKEGDIIKIDRKNTGSSLVTESIFYRYTTAV